VFAFFPWDGRDGRVTRHFRLCGCLHPETSTAGRIAVLRSNCFTKDGSPIAITVSVHVHITGSNISKQLRRYVERSLSAALGDAAERVVAVEVELSDVNTCPARHDNLCGIRAELRRAGIVFVHGRSADPHAAVDRAGMRLKTALTMWPASQTYGRFDKAS
jgi:ribosome-associated translation inhibitor RaiA